MTAVFAGLGLGFAVAAGFGPISVLALTSGLRCGFAPAFGVGLGAALVDGLYALLATGSTVAGRRLGERALRTASVVAGLAIGAFGLVFVVRGLLVLL